MGRLTVARKVGSGFLMMGVLLIACGVAGYHVAGTLSASLGAVTGPIWRTAEAAKAGTQAVQLQLIAVDRQLRSRDPESERLLADAKRQTEAAYDRVGGAGLVSEVELRVLRQGMDRFDAVREALLGAHAAFQASEKALAAGASAFHDFLTDVERIASQQLLADQMHDTGEAEPARPATADPPQGTQSTEPPEDAGGADDDWATINAVGEARLALLTRLYLLGQLLAGRGDGATGEALQTALSDLRMASGSIAESPVFRERSLRSGAYAGQTYVHALEAQVARHADQLADTLERHRQLGETRAAYQEAAGGLMGLGDAYMIQSRDRVDSETRRFEVVAAAGHQIILLTMVLGLVLAVPAYWLTARSITRPLAEVHRQLRAMAEGEGDLSVSLQVKGSDEIATLASTFNVFTGKLRAIIGSLQASVDRLSSTAAEISQVAEETHERVHRQQREVDMVAGAMEELSSSFQGVSGNTNHAAENATAADQAAGDGRALVRETVTSIERLAAEVELATRVVNDLGRKSERIGSVLDVIREISEQTNLLALNAAIEAARAGEQGRGFAVVADEVRSLAGRTHESTREIQSTIDELQRGAREAITVMERGRTQAGSSVQQAGNAGQSLDEITRMVTGISALSSQVARALEEQARTVDEAGRSVASIRDVSAQTATSAVALARVTQSLGHVADELQGLARQFKV